MSLEDILHNYSVLIVEAPFYEDVSKHLFEGASSVLEQAGVNVERLEVPGALEIPAAIKLAHLKKNGTRPFDAYVALGCVVRGETSHYDVVANESASGLSYLALRCNLAIGNGILTCDSYDQALKRARPDKKNKGAAAANAALRMLEIKQSFRADLKAS